MSFVKKAVKKVFSGIKRLFKNKIFQVVLAAAAIFFTAGVAAVGFGGFAGVSSVGGFMSAVGSTMASGASAIGSLLTGGGFTGAQQAGAATLQAIGEGGSMLGSIGTSAGSIAAKETARQAAIAATADVGAAVSTGVMAPEVAVGSTAPAAVTSVETIIPAAETALSGAGEVALAQGEAAIADTIAGASVSVPMNAAATATNTGFWNSVTTAFAKVKSGLGATAYGNTTYGELVMGGIKSGASAYLASQASKDERANGYFFGGRAFGDDTFGPTKAFDFSQTAGSNYASVPQANPLSPGLLSRNSGYAPTTADEPVAASQVSDPGGVLVAGNVGGTQSTRVAPTGRGTLAQERPPRFFGNEILSGGV